MARHANPAAHQPLVLVALGSKHEVEQPRRPFERVPAVRAEISHPSRQTAHLMAIIEEELGRHPGRSRGRMGREIRALRMAAQNRLVQLADFTSAYDRELP